MRTEKKEASGLPFFWCSVPLRLVAAAVAATVVAAVVAAIAAAVAVVAAAVVAAAATVAIAIGSAGGHFRQAVRVAAHGGIARAGIHRRFAAAAANADAAARGVLGRTGALVKHIACHGAGNRAQQAVAGVVLTVSLHIHEEFSFRWGLGRAMARPPLHAMRAAASPSPALDS